VKRIRPRAVIFDYGNVLSAPQGPSEIETMASILNVSVDDFLEAYWRFRVSYDEAALDPVSYWHRVSQRLSRSLPGEQIATLVEVDSQSWSYPARVLPQWARELRAAGLKTALLSNMPATVRDHVLRCDWLPPFDHRTFSCEVRIAKPAAAIFQHCLIGLDVDPQQILFLDDRPENVHAAETLGVHGIVYKTAHQAARDIAGSFDIPVPLVVTLYEGNAENQ
jgi:putative hydrolase of the HAD superfamily